MNGRGLALVSEFEQSGHLPSHLAYERGLIMDATAILGKPRPCIPSQVRRSAGGGRPERVENHFTGMVFSNIFVGWGGLTQECVSANRTVSVTRDNLEQEAEAVKEVVISQIIQRRKKK